MRRRTDPLRIVLSGPLGAGKSTVGTLLMERDCVVIDADSVGHGVLLPDGAAFDAVADRWPCAVHDGAIDRSRLAAIVFAEPGELADLESITHPAIGEEIARRVAEVPERHVVVEMPLIEPIVAGEEWHRLVVIAPDAIRLERATRRGMDSEDAMRRMASQPTVVEWAESADSVLVNDGDLGGLEAAVAGWWQSIVPPVDEPQPR